MAFLSLLQEDEFILNTMREALDVDSSIHTHPVSVKVRNAAEINEIVDTITYHKVTYLKYELVLPYKHVVINAANNLFLPPSPAPPKKKEKKKGDTPKVL